MGFQIGRNKLNLVNKKFGKLMVIKVAYIKNKAYYYLCKCDCGKEKIIYGSSLFLGKSKSCGCSRKGRTAWNKGKKHSELTKFKISQSHKGKKLTNKHKQKIRNALKGKKRPPRSKEWGEKIGLSHKGLKLTKLQRTKISGKNNHNWKGGITQHNQIERNKTEYQEWRKNVLIRDNFVCCRCKNRNGIHQPHHILNFAQYPQFRFDIKNGITFCKKCHKEFHKIYGQNNNNKDQIDDFINNYVSTTKTIHAQVD